MVVVGGIRVGMGMESLIRFGMMVTYLVVVSVVVMVVVIGVVVVVCAFTESLGSIYLFMSDL